MFNQEEQEILKKALIKQRFYYNYYSSLAVILIIFVWWLYFAIPRTAFLINALILSIGIWYFPFRHYCLYKLIKKDLNFGEIVEVNTFLYAKKASKFNRLQPYYFLYTDNGTFEVDKAIFDVFKVQVYLRIRYSNYSRTILSWEFKEPTQV